MSLGVFTVQEGVIKSFVESYVMRSKPRSDYSKDFIEYLMRLIHVKVGAELRVVEKGIPCEHYSVIYGELKELIVSTISPTVKVYGTLLSVFIDFGHYKTSSQIEELDACIRSRAWRFKKVFLSFYLPLLLLGSIVTYGGYRVHETFFKGETTKRLSTTTIYTTQSDVNVKLSATLNPRDAIESNVSLSSSEVNRWVSAYFEGEYTLTLTKGSEYASEFVRIKPTDVKGVVGNPDVTYTVDKVELYEDVSKSNVFKDAFLPRKFREGSFSKVKYVRVWLKPSKEESAGLKKILEGE